MPKPVNTEDFAARLGPNWKIARQKRPRRVHSRPADVSAPHGGAVEESGVLDGAETRCFCWKTRKGKDVVLISTVWDTAEDAEKFYAAMDEWFRQRYPKTQRIKRNSNRLLSVSER